MTVISSWRNAKMSVREYLGLAADAKPTAGIPLASKFLETDTGIDYVWSGSAWVALVTRATPLQKANVHNTAKGADTVVLASDLAPTYDYSLFRIMVAINSATVFNAVITKSSDAQTVKFNSGSNLVANAVYIFDMLVHTGDTVNFKCTGAVTYLVMRVQEIAAGGQ